MIGWFEGGSITQTDAETFVKANIAAPLPRAA